MQERAISNAVENGTAGNLRKDKAHKCKAQAQLSGGILKKHRVAAGILALLDVLKHGHDERPEVELLAEAERVPDGGGLFGLNRLL